MPAPEPAVLQRDGTLVLNLQPGGYALNVSGLPETGYARAAQIDQRDVLEQFVQVSYDTRAPLEIQLAFDGGQIRGTVTDVAGKGADRATVVLVPDKSRRHRPDQYRIVTSTTDGQFAIGGVPPGEYKIFVWDEVEHNAWMNADFMSSYEELGVGVSVKPFDKATAQLRVIP
jgi:hypothetical protein